MREKLLEELKKLAMPALEKKPEDRTYRDRFYIWEYERVKDKKSYNEGEEVSIWDGTRLANNEIKDGFGNDFPEWFRNYGKCFGKQVKSRADGKVYTLVGMSYTYLDYYFIFEKDGKKQYATCLGGIEVLA